MWTLWWGEKHDTSQIHSSVFFFLFFYWKSTLSPESRAPISVCISTLSTGAGLGSTVPSPTGTWRSIRGRSLYEMWENCVTRAWQTTSLFLFSFCCFSPSSPSFDDILSLYLHPNMTAGVCMGPHCHCTPDSLFLLLCLCQSVQNQASELNEEHNFAWAWNSPNVLVLWV